MSQNDFTIANQGFPGFRSDLNNALQALASSNSGSSAPSPTFAYQVWIDTSVSPAIFKMRNGDNDAWITIGTLNSSNDTFSLTANAALTGTPTSPSPGVADDSTKIATTEYVRDVVNSGATSMFRNRLINGAMRIDQRNAGANQTITAGAAIAYTVDRWYAYCTGANITGARYRPASTAPFYYRFTGAASNTGLGFGQRIEAANSIDLAGKTCTLSAKISSSSITSVTWTAYYANTVDTFGTLASPTRTQIATGTFSITSTEATYSAQIAVSASATTGIEIVFTTGALLASQTFTIRDVQFELGDVVTPFEIRPIDQEIASCKRYYQQPDEYGIAVSTYANSNASTQILRQLFPIEMRSAVPTVTVTSYQGTANKITVYDGSNYIDRAFDGYATRFSFGFYISEGSAIFTVNQLLTLSFTYKASAEL